MGTVHSEIANITQRLEQQPADFVLVDHSKASKAFFAGKSIEKGNMPTLLDTCLPYN